MIPFKLFKNRDKERITAIGELLIDFVPTDPKGLLEDPGTIIKTASGSSGIFACAVANLGGEAGFLGQLGKDKLSQFVLNIIKDQGVDISKIKIIDEGQVGLAFIEYTPEGRNYQFYRKDSVGSKLSTEGIDEDYIRESAAIHYSGMLLELNPIMREACIKSVNIARENGVIVSFDPNIRKELIKSEGAVDRLKWAVSNADVISPTLDEAKFITGEDKIYTIIEKLHDMGPKVVALTMDKDGAVLSCDKEIIRLYGIEINAVDPTGAGDTFAAALITGILKGWELENIGIFSNCAGAMATMKQGVIGIALPKLEELEDFINNNECRVEYLTRGNEECAS